MNRALILLVLLLAATGVIAGPAAASGSAPAATERLQALDREILVRLNETRVAHGLRPLVLSDDLQEAAVSHSRAMLEGGFFAHESKDGSSFVARLKRHYRAAGYNAWSAGENLLYNTDPVDAETAIEAWLASPAHRENMLTPEWREVGIGSVHAASAGGTFGGEPTWVITVDFGTRTGGTGSTRPASQPATARSKPGNEASPIARPPASKPRPRSVAKPAKPAAPPKPVRQRIVRVLPLPAHSTTSDAETDDDSIPPAGDATVDPVSPGRHGDDQDDSSPLEP